MGRHSCCQKQKLRKGLWSPEEDEKLVKCITTYGHGCWSNVPRLAGLERCGKSCRLRWKNYLRPDLKRGAFSLQEEKLIIDLHAIVGNRLIFQDTMKLFQVSKQLLLEKLAKVSFLFQGGRKSLHSSPAAPTMR
ncbi:hypothetical protein SELMODRAFT_84195 [Selaginella moellendorffii]|uniref:Uncharacterized protein n=1 Tax=Selaginella moellendorffii TaxID=88036 RepID=D8R3V3_SELML|nr:hypothetical protein SELMODRAFT_84195 [Selaginella moellendorffii]